MSKITTTTLVCLLTLSTAGCAIELPKSAFDGFRLGPADEARKGDAVSQQRQAPKPVSAD